MNNKVKAELKTTMYRLVHQIMFKKTNTTIDVDDIMFSRISSLYNTYKDFPSIAQFYENNLYGYICVLGNSAFLSGEHEKNELFEFAKIFGIVSISGKTGDWENCSNKKIKKPIMIRTTPIHYPCDVEVAYFPEKKTVFNILLSQDSFKDVDYLHWLSDIASRQSHQTARIFTVDEKATAGVYFIAEGIGIISGVVTLPQYRGQKIGLKLVGKICDILQSEGILPVVIAESQMFYNKLGFNTICYHSYVLL